MRIELAQALIWPVTILALAAQSRLASAQQRETSTEDWSKAVPVAAHVRVLDGAGQLIEGRVAAKRDTVLWLEGKGALPGQRILLSDIRSLEVRIVPVSRQRTIVVSVGIGAVLGAIAGAASHGDTDGGSPGLGSKPSRFENVSVGAVFGAAIGWALGRFVLARARWQQVRLR